MGLKHLRQKITQEIPIVNNSDKDWVINAKYTGDTSNFKGNTNLKVKAGEEASYKLRYQAEWVSEASAQHVIKMARRERICFKLRGTADEPLAEGTFVSNVKLGKEFRSSSKFEIQPVM